MIFQRDRIFWAVTRNQEDVYVSFFLLSIYLFNPLSILLGYMAMKTCALQSIKHLAKNLA